MVRTDADWKSERPNRLSWVTVALAVGLVALYVATWLRTDGQEPLVLAILLTAWVGVYFTRYWQPILYLVAVIVFGGIVAVDLLTGVSDVPFYWLVVATTAAFVATAIYLFVIEESYG
jgi:hypothetical protein